MKTKLEINYTWNSSTGEEISKEHKAQLKDEAESRIFNYLKESYSSGELHATIPNDNGEEVEYSGFWVADYSEVE